MRGVRVLGMGLGLGGWIGVEGFEGFVGGLFGYIHDVMI